MIARPATPDDADELVRLRAVLLTSMNPPIWDDAWRKLSRETLIDRLAPPTTGRHSPASPAERHGGGASPAERHGGGASPAERHGGGASPAERHGGGASPAERHGGLRGERPASSPTMAAFVVDRPDGAGLAACAVGTIEHRLGAPGDPQGRTGYVFSVATDPDMRRRGFSRQCMTALLDWFRAQGVRKVDLRASAEAEPLYRSLGFARTPDPAMRLRLDG